MCHASDHHQGTKAFTLPSLPGPDGEVNVRIDACPSNEMLLAFDLGELPESAIESIRERQESCPRCKSRASNWTIEPIS